MVDLVVLLRRVAVGSLAGAIVVVAAIGALGVYAEFADTWIWFFRMERAASVAVPLVLALLGLSITSAVGVVVGTR